jgi:hypothetical protein
MNACMEGFMVVGKVLCEICIYVYMYVYVCVHIYIHVYMYKDTYHDKTNMYGVYISVNIHMYVRCNFLHACERFVCMHAYALTRITTFTTIFAFIYTASR